MVELFWYDNEFNLREIYEIFTIIIIISTILILILMNNL
jgi:hypothetical protein